MTTYTLWDVQSSSLLLETSELGVIAESTASYVLDNGEEALNDLLLGIESDETSLPQEHSGPQILSALKREQASWRSA